jgi:ABC-2 type transport system permease protein
VLNMIKMDVYRMFRTKSMYVIWIILLASALLTSFLSKIDYDAANKECDNIDDQRRYLDIIRERLNSLNEMLEELFTFTKLKNITA